MTDWLKILKNYVDTLETLVGTIDAATTDSLHGKLGTDTELADYSLYDLLGGNAFKTNALSAMLGAFTSAQNLKTILGDLSSTKRLGQILGLDETDTLKAILGAFTAAQNLKAILGDLSTTKNLGGILGAFTAAQNLKAILGDLTTTKNLGGVLGALTTTDNLKGILGGYTTAANLKAAIDALALEATLGTHDTDIKALLGTIDAATTDSLHGKLGTDTELADYSLYDLLGGNAFKTNALSAMLGAFTSAQNLKAILGDLTTTKNLGGVLGALTTTDNLKAILGAYTAAANLKAAIDNVALEATLGTHDTDIKNLLSTIAGYLTTEIADILAAVDTEVADIKTQTDKIAGKMLFSMDFWSDPQEEVVMTGGQTTPALPTVTIADLPTNATIVRAIAMFKFRMVENTNAAENSLDKTAAQPIQVRSDAPGTWRDAINFVDEQFKIAATTREGGDVLIGSIDIAVEVDGNDGYNFQWLNAKAHLGNLQFNDVQVGLRIWYSV